MAQATIYTDGGARPTNPGPGGFGCIIDIGGKRYKFSRYLGNVTNNIAEYTGIIAGIKYAIELGATEVKIFSDSQLVVNQIKGKWQVKEGKLRPYVNEAKKLLNHNFPNRWTLKWVKRTSNTEADELCTKAILYGRSVNPFLVNPKRGAVYDPFA